MSPIFRKHASRTLFAPVVAFAAILMSGLGAPCLGQTVQERIKSVAEAACAALIAGDLEEFVATMYPPVVAMGGGPEQIIEYLAAKQKNSSAEGFDFFAAEVTSVSEPVAAGPQLHAVVAYTMRVRAPFGTLVQDSFMLAVSEDEGATWTFLDGGAVSPAQLKAILPAFNEDLVLPEISEPKFVPDQEDR